MKHYTKVKVIKITETQDLTLKKSRGYKINVEQFIRDAIKSPARSKINNY
jgi:hypothetical protein